MKFTEATKAHRKSEGEPTALGKASAASEAQRNGEKFPARELRAHRAHVLAISRTRISYLDALERTTCAPFREERRMKFTEATKFHRKSGEPEFPASQRWRDAAGLPRMKVQDRLAFECTNVPFWVTLLAVAPGKFMGSKQRS
jgi:hypothetical protein